MSVVAADLVFYGSANRPTDDEAAVGGAIDLAARPLDTQLSVVTDVEALSDGADTRTLTVGARLADGSFFEDDIILDGTTPVALGQAIERILYATLSAADGARTVTLRIESAGATLHIFNPDETDAFIFFINAASEEAPTVRYEKGFWRNGNGDNALLGAEVTLIADPSEVLRIALDNAAGGSHSAADRLTEPANITAWADDDVAIAVPGTNLGTEANIGTWLELGLDAEHAALKSSGTVELAGTTT